MNGLLVSTALFDDVRSLVLSVRQTISRGVDLLQVHTNYEIGRRIVEQEQHGSDRAEYGKEILKDLSARLTAEFRTGFSRSNLEYMRRFYLAYPSRNPQIYETTSGISGFPDTPALRPIPQTTSGISNDAAVSAPFSLSWSHYVFLLGLNDQERRFYEIEATQQGWTLRELKRQYNAGLFERLALTRDRESIGNLTQQGHQVSKPEDLLKEPYVLEFLGLAEKASYSRMMRGLRALFRWGRGLLVRGLRSSGPVGRWGMVGTATDYASKDAGKSKSTHVSGCHSASV